MTMGRVSTRLWSACERLGLAPTVRRAYLTAWGAPRGWRHRATVGGVEATFRTTSWPEFRRVTTCYGESRVVASLLEDLDGDEVVWDVGANVGLYACFVARVLDEGQVVAIEPEPTNAARLAENLAANAPDERWQVLPVALADTDGRARLASEHPPGERVPGTGHHFLAAGGDTAVECRRGDALVAEGVPTPDVLKVDVQGAEGRVLEGLGGVLAGVDRCYLELHTEKCGRYGTTTDEVEAFLREAGFTVTDLGEPDWNREGVYYVRAERGSDGASRSA